MGKEKEYDPIDCMFYDELEARATRRKPSRLHFRDGSEEKTLEGVVIEDMYTKDGVEYLRLKSDKVIRLDNLLSVDGKEFRKSK